MSTAAGGSSYLQGVGTLENAGHFSTVPGTGGYGRFLNGPIVNEPSGTINLAAGAAADSFGDSSIVNKGTFIVASGTTLHTQDPSVVHPGGRQDCQQRHNRERPADVLDADRRCRDRPPGTDQRQTLSVGAGSGNYDTVNETELTSHLIAAGQHLRVVGDEGGDTTLTLTANTTNDGSIVMTTINQLGGPGTRTSTDTTPRTSRTRSPTTARSPPSRAMDTPATST